MLRNPPLPGVTCTEHRIRVPLDPASPQGTELSVFGRELVASSRQRESLPWLVFLQGGPGFPSPRPTDGGGWIGRALEEFRVLLLDQRGTGSSSPIDADRLARLPSPEAQADWLASFRADSIVRDCEAFRRHLIGDEPWSVLGQSFGGFCAVHYLSAAPEGLREVYITGGLPPLEGVADDVYRGTLPLMRERNERFYRAYPGDRQRTGRLADWLDRQDVRLPSGDRLTSRRLQQLGILLGMSDGPSRLHYLLEEAFADGTDEPFPSWSFLRQLEGCLAWDTNPLFSVLHEPIYAQGAATRWAADRVLAEADDFAPEARPFAFTGEVVRRWMFDEYARLRPLAAAADLLAERTDWPHLYDRSTLAVNRVPCAAAIYWDDLYVVRQASEATARAIAGLRPWVTSRYDHNGLRADGAAILDRLIRLTRGG